MSKHHLANTHFLSLRDVMYKSESSECLSISLPSNNARKYHTNWVLYQIVEKNFLYFSTIWKNTIKTHADKKSQFQKIQCRWFHSSIAESDIFKRPVESLDSFVEQIKKNVNQVLDDLAPFRKTTKRQPTKPQCWLSDAVVDAKRTRWRLTRC